MDCDGTWKVGRDSSESCPERNERESGVPGSERERGEKWTSGSAVATTVRAVRKQFPFEGRQQHITTMASREDNVYMAKLSEQAERYDEMVEAVRFVCVV